MSHFIFLWAEYEMYEVIKMICPNCQSDKNVVARTGSGTDVNVRERFCENCMTFFYTREIFFDDKDQAKKLINLYRRNKYSKKSNT